jgi:multiple antibiotic resistance protein
LHDTGLFDLRLFGTVFVTLMVIMDPIGSVPVFLGLTRQRSASRRRALAVQAVAVAGAVIAAFAMFGQQILAYLGISVPALQGAGGLLLVLVALQLLTGTQQEHSRVENVNVALVPLGTPLLAGPGAIVATIVFVRGGHGVRDALAIAAALLAVHVVLLLVLLFAGGILKVIRDGGVVLLTRISGLLLSAIAVQLIATSALSFARKA